VSPQARASAGEASRNLYEQPALRQVLGPALRPGGLALTQRALAACSLPAGAQVLDVGCGQGATLALLRQEAGLRAWGIDPSLPLLAAWEGAGPLPGAAARAERLPFAKDAFAAVFCECVLSLLGGPSAALALAEFHRVLQAQGLLVLSDLYQRQAAPRPASAELPLVSCLQGALPQAALMARLAEAGFVVELFEDHTRLLKELAARLVLAHGSLAQFWSGIQGMDAPPGALQALLDCRPGYYLLIARKGDRP
jgi:SAM-dependent methyltransferase